MKQKRGSNRVVFFVIGMFFLLLNLSCGRSGKNNIRPENCVEQKKILSKQVTQKEYQVSPSDILKINVYQEKDLNRTVRVSQSGYISYPLIGKIKIAGLTVSKAEEKIANLFRKDYLVDPHVSIFIEEYHARKIFILGAVNKPGSYDLPLQRSFTILEAISLAGGFTKLAAVDKTKIVRIENGVEKNVVVKITDITKKGDKSKDVILKPNDIIVIPETFF
jgi:polysaccharide export outer membrane protein